MDDVELVFYSFFIECRKGLTHTLQQCASDVQEQSVFLCLTNFPLR